MTLFGKKFSHSVIRFSSLMKIKKLFILIYPDRNASFWNHSLKTRDIKIGREVLKRLYLRSNEMEISWRKDTLETICLMKKQSLQFLSSSIFVV